MKLACTIFALAMAACSSDHGSDHTMIDAPNGGDAPGADGPAANPDAALDASPDAPGATMINGCSYDTAEDYTSMSLTVTFPALAYTPKCARIRAGQAVTFSGTFSTHPLQPGTVVNNVATPASSSPIQATSTGTSAQFIFPDAGAFPYYCANHYQIGMTGVIYVDP